MKKLLRILPYLTMVWVAMYVSKETGLIGGESNGRWATKKQCMTAAKEIKKDINKEDYYLRGGTSESAQWKYHGKFTPKKYKPVCYRLTKYSTR